MELGPAPSQIEGFGECGRTLHISVPQLLPEREEPARPGGEELHKPQRRVRGAHLALGVAAGRRADDEQHPVARDDRVAEQQRRRDEAEDADETIAPDLRW